MGYYTDYELAVSGPQKDLDEFRKEALTGRKTKAGMSLQAFYYGMTAYQTKWYYWRDDLIALSEEFPTLLFEIDAVGEEQPDMWRAAARNGKVKAVEPEIIWPNINFDRDLPMP